MTANGRVNGSGPAPQPMQVNPIEVAQLTLMFLSRADFKRHERQQFDVCEAFLQAIASGSVQLVTPEAAQLAPPDPAAAAGETKQ